MPYVDTLVAQMTAKRPSRMEFQSSPWLIKICILVFTATCILCFAVQLLLIAQVWIQFLCIFSEKEIGSSRRYLLRKRYKYMTQNAQSYLLKQPVCALSMYAEEKC